MRKVSGRSFKTSSEKKSAPRLIIPSGSPLNRYLNVTIVQVYLFQNRSIRTENIPNKYPCAGDNYSCPEGMTPAGQPCHEPRDDIYHRIRSSSRSFDPFLFLPFHHSNIFCSLFLESSFVSPTCRFPPRLTLSPSHRVAPTSPHPLRHPLSIHSPSYSNIPTQFPCLDQSKK